MKSLIHNIGFKPTFELLLSLEGKNVTCIYKAPLQPNNRHPKSYEMIIGKLELLNHTITVGDKPLIMYDEIIQIKKK